ncbi:hypothetical protein CKAH01_07389 [Colletotrichum kahawae]|uniref:Uncharacterized protein n=1 Tax=Colletotrichum kahawae TaxID=34407 RepID=A0AAE0D1S8_COLKA|nr:hypothetical protein CKAH01_07389 [Colletotrichum kahawae]
MGGVSMDTSVSCKGTLHNFATFDKAYVCRAPRQQAQSEQLEQLHSAYGPSRVYSSQLSRYSRLSFVSREAYAERHQAGFDEFDGGTVAVEPMEDVEIRESSAGEGFRPASQYRLEESDIVQEQAEPAHEPAHEFGAHYYPTWA